jgi:uncharacterized RDD family membrane protein YckC/energy-coupling factor transporter ATP-binding protein EcfA2
MRAAGVGLKNPFPGIRPFQEGEEHIFFGRERQVDTMVDKLAATRFLAVVGTSGSGKSSLVNCGLRPALHRGLMARAGTAWRIAQFRPGGNPLRALAEALAAPNGLFGAYRPEGVDLEDMVEATLRMGSVGLVDVYEQAQTGEPVNLLVVADQFEELFRYRQAADRKPGDYGATPDAIALVNLLLRARSDPRFPIYVALTMRSDYLGECAQFDGLPETINESQFLVPRLTRDERRAAIAGPIAVAGAELDPVLLTRLVNDVGDNPDQLSILQHALNRTWAYWHHEGNAKGPLSLVHYESIGTMANALDRHAEKAYGELSDTRQRDICQKIFRTLTDRGTDARGVRRPTTMRALCAIAAASPEEVTAVIDVFRKASRSFLMPPCDEELEPAKVVDISHESLMRVWQRLRKWTDDEASSARMYRRLAETAQLHATEGAGLWRDPDLQRALDWRRKENPTATWGDMYAPGFDGAMEFLDKSRKARDMERTQVELARRWRPIETAFVIAMLAVFLFTFERHFSYLRNHVFDFQGDTKLVQALRGFLSLGVLLLPYTIAYLGGLNLWGRMLYRQMAFDRILAQVEGAVEATPAVEEAPADLVFAPFWKRTLAWVIDLILFLLAFVFWVIVSMALPADYQMAVVYGGLFASDWLYDALACSSRWQGTLGKHILGIIVTDAQGRRLPLWRSAARHLAKMLSWYTLGFLLSLFTNKRQMLHDLAARTLVLTRQTAPTDSPRS